MNKFFYILLVTYCFLHSSICQEVCKNNYECESDDLVCRNGSCVKKDLYPINIKQFIGMILIFVFGGIFILPSFSGGVIIFTIFLTFFQFSPQKAASLNNLIIMVNAFVMFLIGYRKRDPFKKNQILIDYSFILVYNPPLLFGGVMGDLALQWLPKGVIFIILILMMTVSLIASIYSLKINFDYNQIPQTISKKYIESQKELKDVQQISINDSIKNKIQNSLRENNQNSVSQLKTKIDLEQNQQNTSQNCKKNQNNSLEIINITTQQEIKEENNYKQVKEEPALQKKPTKFYSFVKKFEKSHLNPIKVFCFLCQIIVVAFFGMIRGSGRTNSIVDISNCSLPDFLLLFICFIILVFLQVIFSYFVYKEINEKKKYSDFMSHEMDFSVIEIIKYSLIIFTIGFFSMFHGMGAGIFMYPLYALKGVVPEIIAYTGIVMILIAKSTAFVVHLANKHYETETAITFCLLSSVVTFLIVQANDKYIKKFKKQEILTYEMITGLITGLAFVIYYFHQEGLTWNFRNYCQLYLIFLYIENQINIYLDFMLIWLSLV